MVEESPKGELYNFKSMYSCIYNYVQSCICPLLRKVPLFTTEPP